MSFGLILFLSVLGLAINCYIMYHIVRLGARSALEDVLSRFVEHGAVAKDLQKIRELLEQAQKSSVIASPTTPATASPATASVHAGAHLVAINEEMACCSVCGKEQRSNRSICYACGIRFTVEREVS